MSRCKARKLSRCEAYSSYVAAPGEFSERSRWAFFASLLGKEGFGQVVSATELDKDDIIVKII